MVGTGWGLVHVHALRAAQAEVVALVGRTPERTRALAQELGIAYALHDAAELAGLPPQTQPDVVVVATPAHTHEAVAQTVRRALPHARLICEKPVLQAQDWGRFSSTAPTLHHWAQRAAAALGHTEAVPVWVNCAFPHLSPVRSMWACVPRIGALLQAAVHTIHDLRHPNTHGTDDGYAWPLDEALLDLALHPLSALLPVLGLPQAPLRVANGLRMSFVQDGKPSAATPILWTAAHQPFLNGLSHRIELHGSLGQMILEGGFKTGEPWQFELRWQDARGAWHVLVVPSTSNEDPWLAANHASVAAMLDAIVRRRTAQEGLQVGLIDAQTAAHINAAVAQAWAGSAP